MFCKPTGYCGFMLLKVAIVRMPCPRKENQKVKWEKITLVRHVMRAVDYNQLIVCVLCLCRC